MARCEVFDPGEVAISHITNRVCRRCFLMGDDPISGKNFDHRKVWIEEYLREFASCFAVDLLGFALLSNHIHLILRSRPDVVATWSDEEVARRWLKLCPHHRNADGTAMTPTQPEINSIAGCPVKLAEIRQRLSSFSWWMRLLCQRVAMRANREDGESGRFFQDRFKATRLADDASLIACAAYVDLNLIRAAMAETIEQSDYTSVQRRIQSIQDDSAAKEEVAATACPDPDIPETKTPPPEVLELQREPAPQPQSKLKPTPDAFLSPLTIDEQNDSVGPCPSVSGDRCSDKGFLRMSLDDYLEMLDWTARQVAPGKSGCTPASLPPVLNRLGLDAASWCELVCDFGKLFCAVAGTPECVDALRSHRTHRRYHIRRRIRELLGTLD